MPVPAEEVWRPYSERLRENLSQVTDQYLVVKGSPSYWRGKRVLTLEKRIVNSILDNNNIVEDFYSRDAREVMLAGMRTIIPGIEDLPEDAAADLAAMVDRSRKRIAIAQRSEIEDVRRWGDMVRDHPKGARGLKSKLRNGPVKGSTGIMAGKRYQPGMYPDMNIRADANTAYNRGIIYAARQEGLKYVRIVDGTDCGLVEHDDPNKADGLIMKTEEAYQYPIAHPSCQRTFVIDDDTRKRKRSGRSSQKSATAARVAVGIGAAVTASMLALRYNQALQRAVTQYLARNSQEFAAYHARWLRDTQTPDDDILNTAAADQWAVFYGQDVSEITRQYLRIPATRKAVGDDFDDLTDFTMARRYDIFSTAAMNFENSIARDMFDLIPTQVGNVDLSLPKIFSSYPSLGARYRDVTLRAGKGGIGGSFSRLVREDIFGDMFRFGYAKSVRNEHGIPYIGIRPHQLVRYRLSKVKHGFANRLVMNPNGMLRAGFAIDPRNGYVIPNLSFIPKGPIRINTYLNRVPGRQVTGVINTTRLRRALRKTSAGALVDAPTVSLDDILLRGLGDNDGRLKVSDFAEGKVENMLTVALPGVDPADRVIGYGVIRNALEAGDELVDLEIRNGKFRTNVIVGTGRITSVSTDIRLMLPKSAVASIRFNTNLRQLGLDSLADIRHLSWSQVKSLRYARTRVVSLALELRAMRYTPLEISKVLRMKASDIERMLREGDVFFLQAGLNTLRKREGYVPARWRADLYEFFTRELAERDRRPVHERLDITENQLDRLWAQAETAWGRTPMHGMAGDDVATALSNQIIDASSMVMSLTVEDVATALFPVGRKNFKRAEEIRDLAAVSLMKETVRTNPRLAEYWGRAVYTNDPLFIRGYQKGLETLEVVRQKMEYDGSLSGFDIPEELVADISAAIGIIRERFPTFTVPDFDLRTNALDNTGAFAAFDMSVDTLMFPHQYFDDINYLERTLKDLTREKPNWLSAIPHPVSVFVHEFGHAIHAKVYSSANYAVREFMHNLKIRGIDIVTTAPQRLVFAQIKAFFAEINLSDEVLAGFSTLEGDELRSALVNYFGRDRLEMEGFFTDELADFFNPKLWGLADLNELELVSDMEFENWYRLYVNYNPKVYEYLQENLSIYGSSDPFELIAESVAESLAGGSQSIIGANITRILAELMNGN